MALTPTEVKDRIDRILDGYRAVAQGSAISIIPTSITAGKLYEGWVLCEVLRNLRNAEGYDVVLHNSNSVTLKSSPGPINRTYPFFELTCAGRPTVEVWTDVEFLTLSYAQRSFGTALNRGDYHELDIVVVPADSAGRPSHDTLWLGVECKNTGYTKDLLRSILGVRRELSLLAASKPTQFSTWPRRSVPADPASCLSVYSTDAAVLSYAEPGNIFGIDFHHLELP
jgi:hypothetical protein